MRVFGIVVGSAGAWFGDSGSGVVGERERERKILRSEVGGLREEMGVKTERKGGEC